MRSPRRTGTGTRIRARPGSWHSDARRPKLAAEQASREPRRLIVNVDGGSRGNPGPAAAAAVVAAPDGELLEQIGVRIGRATNNEAEYRALLLGIERARALGATEVELIGDSELVVRQVRGEYRVKKPDLKPLHAEALAALRDFDSWAIRSVPREQNEAADALVNETLDAS